MDKDESLFKPEQEPPVIHSRFAESRDARLQFMNNKRMKLESEVKREKKLRKKEREDILKEIESDRRAKEGKSQTYGDNASSVAIPTTSTAPGGQNDACLIQIRLPDARNLRHEFSSEQKINDILVFVKSNLSIPSGKTLSLLQPFPRKEFDPEDPSSIKELGFCPKMSLVARFVDEG
ncbi:UBX domain-containing protein 1-like [Ciona intestinalis]